MEFSLKILNFFQVLIFYVLVMNLSVSCCDKLCKYTKNIPFKHFWKSTGLSPPDPNDADTFLLAPDEKFNLIFIGSLPHHGIRQVRIHWLLNLITYNESIKTYNYSKLDVLLDFMYGNNLRPGFELMGIPKNIKTKEVKMDIYTFWYELTQKIAKRYIGRFGYDEVQKWRFETMNEPDLKLYNFLNFTLSEYLQYFKACTDALHNISSINTEKIPHTPKQLEKQRNYWNNWTNSSENVTITNRSVENRNKTKRRTKVSSLRVGGPAGLFKRRDRHPLCWGALDMCNRSACHLHYVSFHKKGGGRADQVLSEDLDMLELLQKYSFTKNLPIANNEADILTNWSLNETWRADVWYAAMISKVIIDHYKEIILKRNVSIEVLSNDNGFMNYHPYYFTQRTLLARFQMNNTKPKHVQFIKKPVYIAMGLLSMLGDEFEPTKDIYREKDEFINVLYTKRTSKYANLLSVIVVALNDTETTQKIKNITLDLDIEQFSNKKFNKNTKLHKSFENCPLDGAMGKNINKINKNVDPPSLMITYALDNDATNPYQVWKENKSPDFPDKALRKLMRRHEGPVREITELKTLKTKWRVAVKIPSIHLINICVDPTLNTIPGEVIMLRGYYVTYNEVLLTWSDKKVRSRCIKTYEVEYKASQNGTFERINDEDLILLSYQHDESCYSVKDMAADYKMEEITNFQREMIVRYRVRAVDFWDRPGPYSNIVGNSDIIHL